MPETIHDWYNTIIHGLERRGIDKITIDSLLVKDHFCAGKYDSIMFTITWVRNHFLLLSMSQYRQELVDAFSFIVEYKPFARYDRDGYTTVEWDKVNPENRWRQLRHEKNLVRMNIPKSN